MARKIFLSFLGTNDYVECNYYLEDDPGKKISNVKYIQEALVKIHKDDWTENDRLIFCLTNDARKQNWENDQQYNPETKQNDKPNKGLAERLSQFKEEVGINATIETVSIPEGFSSDEVWIIFQRLFEKFQPDDKIYLDVTHAFRSIPILGMVLLNFLKAIHNIEVEAIYYGAFEKLGFASRVKQMEVDKRNAPILNLKSLSILQDWTNAANEFVNYGKAESIILLAHKEIIPILRGNNERTELARKINLFGRSLEKIVDSLETNRGETIVNGKIFDNFNKNLDEISDRLFIVPMQPLLIKIKENVESFNPSEDWKNGLRAVKWCLDHDMTQQGITMLQETIITYICIENELDYSCKNDRDLVNACFYIKGSGMNESEWNEIAMLRKEKVLKVIASMDDEVVDDFQSLTQSARNDINHGGFTQNASPHKLKQSLLNSYKLICNSLVS